MLHASRQTPDRESGKIKTEKLDPATWLRRESPHLRILSDELADAVRKKLNLAAQSFGKKAKDRPTSIHRTELYPKVLIRPICGCCEHPMLLGRSAGKYHSFFCHNPLHGMKGCTNRGYKSARIIDEAALGAVSAIVFTEGFISGLTSDVNARLEAAVKVPLGSTKKLQDEVTSRERQIARLTARLDKVDDASGLDAIFERVRLAAKREELERFVSRG